MLLDDGQMYINEALTPSQRNQLFQVVRKYSDLIRQVESDIGVSIDKSEVESVLSDARNDDTTFPSDEEGFKKLYDFHDELYKNLTLGAYRNKVLEMIFFASKFATMIGLEPNSRDMKLLSDYLVDNVGLLAQVETDIPTMLDKVKSKLRISEASKTFDYETRLDPVVIARQLLDALESSHSRDDLAALTAMLSTGTASPTTASPTASPTAGGPTASISDIDDFEAIQAAVNKYQSTFFDAMGDAFIKRAATIINDEGQFKKFFSNPRFFDANHGESLESFKQSFNVRSPDYNKANDFFESLGLTNSNSAVQRHALELADALQIKKLSESQEPKKEVVGIKFDLKKCKEQAQLNENFAMLFGGWAQYLMRAMFGDLNIPVQVTGTQREIESLAKALRSEQGYLNLVSKYGLDDERTYNSKSKLDKAASNFERETGLKWPFA